MKHKEVFRIYNSQDIKRNKFPIILIALSIFLAVLVSLVIPQLKVSKEQYIEKNNKNLSSADLMVNVSFPSDAFNEKLEQYKEEGIEIEQINISPTYYQYEGNQILVYLLSGYQDLEEEVIISKTFADANGVKINDNIQLSDLPNQMKVTEIELLPIEVTVDAEVAGYIKTKQSEISANNSGYLLFLSGKDGEKLKKELSSVEDGYKYYTHKERQEQLYGTIDKEIGALSLISSVGFILSISVLVSGIIMLIIKSKKDIANLMLISIARKDIIKAMKKEVNIIIFIPLFLAIILCVPVSLYIMKLEAMPIDLSEQYILNIVKFVIFDILLFILYRNLALHYIKKIDPVLVEKGEGGLHKLRFYEIIEFLLPFPLTMIIYSALLQSGTSVSVNIFLALAILVMFSILWLLISIISLLPVWRHWRFTLYAFRSLRTNKLIFVVGSLNLAMLICFILIGFNLSTTLKASIDKTLATNIPYDYIIRTSDMSALEDILGKSADVQGYLKLNYLETKVDNDEVQDKNILLMNEEVAEGKLHFEILEGKGDLQADTSEVLISEKYAKAYNFTVGSILQVYVGDDIHSYTVKGIYDSGGINVNWILKHSKDQYNKAIYLAKYKSGTKPNGLKDCYLSNVSIIGSYSLAQANDFLKSFKILSVIFVFSAIIFNINMVYMGQQLLRKDFAIIEALGIGKEIINQQMWIKAIMTIVSALLVSSILYTIIMNVMIQFIATGSAILDFNIIAFTALIAICVVSIGYIMAKATTKNCLDEIRE